MNDIVLLKSSDQSPRLPTYHFAHVVDDTLMRVTVVLRGEEWISSVPVHLQLFNALGFKPIPYAHIAPLMKFDGASRRKLSKRKDNEADVAFYMESGYPAGAVLHYLRGLANSRFAEMTFEESASSALSLSDCGVAGPIFDLVKLESISREFIAQLPIEEALEGLLTWARENDPELSTVLTGNLPQVRRIFANERNPAVQRKDLAKWNEFRAAYGLYFQELFPPVSDASDPRFAPVGSDMVVKLAKGFADSYRHEDNKEAWFEQIRKLASDHGFAPTAGQYKKSPEKFCRLDRSCEQCNQDRYDRTNNESGSFPGRAKPRRGRSIKTSQSTDPKRRGVAAATRRVASSQWSSAAEPPTGVTNRTPKGARSVLEMALR